MNGSFSDEDSMTVIMQNEELIPDHRASMMEKIATLAGQIFCARSGEPIGERLYGATDAVRDASYLLTIALNPGEVERYLAKAAEVLDLPTIWPSDSTEDPASEEPF